MKSLVLAEKPSVAREIARVLKCNIKNKGFIEGPQYVVTWALGHLVTLAEPEDYDQKYKEWRMEDLPMLPEQLKLKVIRQTSQQYQTVSKLMKRNDINELIIATDAGREGELVARWIMRLSNWKKPFKRLWISSQTDAAILEGFARLKPGPEYNDLYDAAVCRAEADWLIGLNVTRALTCKYNAQLNSGRVQTPTLAMIVQREDEIRKFVPVDYWTIRADFGDFFADWRGKDGSRIYDYQQVEALLGKLEKQSARIMQVKRESKSEPAPLAYDLTELQRDANRKLSFSAQKTSSTLQNLYERHKLVTYPRTDSRYLSADIVPTLPSRLKGLAAGPYAETAKKLLAQPYKPTKRLVDDSKVTDHHAIIPTEQPLKLGDLTHDEKSLYDLIVRRFLAVLSPPYRYDQLTVIAGINGEMFYATGKVMKDQGWRSITSHQTESEESREDALPEQTLGKLEQSEERMLKNLKPQKGKTKPPARYTEATLLTAMENPGKFIEDEELRETMKGSGLGTPATRAEIIEKLLHTSYIERSGKELVPTSKGRQLISLVAPELRSPELTAQWEQALTDIAKGNGSKTEFIKGIRTKASELVHSVASDSATYHADNMTKTRCPVCKKYMLLVNGKRGKMLVCQDRACGHRQPEKERDTGFTSSKRASQVNQKLIAQYSDQQNIGSNLGDLLKEALNKQNKD
ncbi:MULTISPECIES: DNA topoisomerase III [Dehalobacter]|jgi:DNA topoisomerase-3|uniref:DNA topoisomerase III n=1 Tax=Dehalobacter TaxID=56112 RepID=UPI0002FA65D5|nr:MULTISPECIES: DNA topoisomerase III [unclassified Dehalobacter]MCG1026254.1 DNA topoisomerase III [Dehalobacter sp.]MDJ0306595.1 DNA topoisomerase III [Dehalobacter sp.]OCZ53301.1 DNA topoisomerase III [Dehalobacter sp. TeCB1]